MTLVEFLLARIAEDERRAHWYDLDEGPYEPGETVRAIYRPARVLAECDAKRRIIDRHVDPDSRACNCSEMGWPTDLCDVIRPLAAVYADHPDYQEEWKP